jgi:glycosyltransferase involved in cell wall biosynthesis
VAFVILSQSLLPNQVSIKNDKYGNYDTIKSYYLLIFVKRALLVLTRNPFIKPSGRKKVLRTIISSLQAGGCRVDLAILDKDPGEAVSHEGEIFWLDTPGVARILGNAVSLPFVKGFSLNECVYFTRELKKKIGWLIEIGSYDLVVGDMVRTAPLLERSVKSRHFHLHLDLDDLLSTRYAQWCASGEGAEALLGYFGDRLPSFALTPITWAARRMLKWESKRMAIREIYWANFADSVSLVSSAEAARLAEKVKKPVEAMPMAVEVKPSLNDLGFRATKQSRKAVFVGGLRYRPNLEAVRFYCKKIAPLLKDNGLANFKLDVIGEAPEQLIKEFEDCEQIHFRSFVDDLDAALAEYPLFLAPLVSGETGVKTKILEAFAAGLPVITSKFGTTGLDVQDRVHYFNARTAEEFVSAISEALEDQQNSPVIANNGYQFVRNQFSTEVLAARWKNRILSQLIDSKEDDKLWELTLAPSSASPEVRARS